MNVFIVTVALLSAVLLPAVPSSRAYDRGLTCDFDLLDANALVELSAACLAIRLDQPQVAQLMLDESLAYRRFAESLRDLERSRDAQWTADGPPAAMLWQLRRDLYDRFDLLACGALDTQSEYLRCLVRTHDSMAAELRLRSDRAAATRRTAFPAAAYADGSTRWLRPSAAA